MFRLAVGSTHPLIQLVPGVFPRGWSGQGMTLATHLHAVLRLRMSGAVSPLHFVLLWCAQGHLWSLIQREFDSGVLGRSSRKWQGGRGKCIMRSFGIFLLHEMLIRIWWTGRVPCTRERGTAYRVLVGKLERESLGTPSNRCEDNVRINHEDRWWKNMDWNLVNLA